MTHSKTFIEKLYSIYLKHSNVITNSRHVLPGCLFFALKGDRFDGNTFAQKAIEAGAAYAIIDDSTLPKHEQFLLVDDVLDTLQALATYHRRKFSIPVLAITGSNGKTTTKELIYSVLSSHFKTHSTTGNFNNHIGVPLTLLAMKSDTEIGVIEMGANHPGEIDALCRIAEPNLGLITNVGKAHLEGFGGFEGVKKTKSELYRFLRANEGAVFINSHEPHLTDLAKNNKQKIFYGPVLPDSEAEFYQVKLLSTSPFVQVSFETAGTSFQIESQLIGEYNFGNIATAITLGLHFKVPGQKIKTAIESYVPSNNRSQLLKFGSNTFILDAYNANPTSVRNALKSFSSMKAPQKWVILGAMKELGIYSETEHEELVQEVVNYQFDTTILVGKEFEKSAISHQLRWFDNAAELSQWFRNELPANSCILVKGSRSIGLECILDEFRENKSD